MKQCSPAGNSARTKGAGDPGSVRALSRKLAAEFLSTLWLVLSGCGSPVLAAKFPEVAALAVPGGAPVAGTAVAGLVHAWLGAEDSATDR